MQCPFCGQSIADDSKFCPFCGQPAQQPVIPVINPVAPIYPTEPTAPAVSVAQAAGAPTAPVASHSTGNLFLWLSIVACVLFLAAVVLGAFLFIHLNEEQEENDALTAQYNEKVDDLNELEAAYSEQQAHLDFYNRYAVIITEGSRRYHRHGCEDLDTQSFWIYNLAAAEQEGYYACPSCHD